jgi:hypothetical protein
MDTPAPAFCDECGAALDLASIYCPVCRRDLAVPFAFPEDLPRYQTGLPPTFALPGSPSAVVSLVGAERTTRRYIILKEIGKGGFGVVYLARDRYNRNQLVAVKQINLRNLSPREMIEATDSYNREVSLLARLRHPHLPHIIDHFTDPEHWYIVLDFIDGLTLDAYLKNVRHRLSPRQVVEIGIALCNVLQYLHDQRPPIIFRDVKPGNIMQTKRGGLYLIDFGIARLFNSAKIHDTGALGSPGYAAPEQYGKAHTTPQTDIYGLGATLQTLFTGLEPEELAASSPQARYWRRIPTPLQPLLQQMLAIDLQERPTVTTVRTRLEHFRDYELTGQKVKHTLAPTQKFLGQPLCWQILVGGSFLYTLRDSNLLLPALLLSLCLVLGRSATEWYIEMGWSLSWLPWKMVRETLLSSCRQMLPFICLIIIFCCAAAQNSDTLWFSSFLFFVAITASICIGYFIYWLYKLLTVLRRMRNKQARMRACHQMQEQMQYHHR